MSERKKGGKEEEEEDDNYLRGNLLVSGHPRTFSRKQIKGNEKE